MLDRYRNRKLNGISSCVLGPRIHGKDNSDTDSMEDSGSESDGADGPASSPDLELMDMLEN